MEADVVLVCVGRRPFTENLGLENVGIQTDKSGRIPTGPGFRTSVPTIRAIGDVIAGPMLAHKAEEEGVEVAEMISAGDALEPHHPQKPVIPNVVYTHPEVAWVGLTEEAARAAVGHISTGVFPFAANSRARTVDDYDGFVKVITEAQTDKLLGVHIIGPNAGELIGEATLAIQSGATSEQVARTCHAHPTLSEAIKEACLAAHGLKKAINC